MVRFDLSQIDKNATITNAKLEMYVEATPDAGTATARLYAVAKSWKEAEATWYKASSSIDWDSEGGDYESTEIASFPISSTSAKKWQSFDATALVKEFVKNPEKNFGFFLYMNNVMVTIEYSSSQSATTANRPKLTVTYEETGIQNNNFSTSHGQFELKRVSGSYLIKVPFSGNHCVGIYDARGALLASVTASQSDRWYELPSSIQPGIHLVRINGNESNIAKKVWFVK